MNFIFLLFIEVWKQRALWKGSGVIYFARDLLRSFFEWNLFIKYLYNCHRLSLDESILD